MRKVIVELYLEGDEVNDEAFGRALGEAIVNHNLGYFPAESYATAREIKMVEVMERMDKVVDAARDALDDMDRMFRTTQRLEDAIKELDGEVTNANT